MSLKEGDAIPVNPIKRMMGFWLKVGEVVLYGGIVATGANTAVIAICILHFVFLTSPDIIKVRILLQNSYKYFDWPFLEQTACFKTSL